MKTFYRNLDMNTQNYTNPRNRDIHTTAQAIQPISVLNTTIHNFEAIRADKDGMLNVVKFDSQARETRETIIADSVNTEANQVLLLKYLSNLHKEHIAEIESSLINKALDAETFTKATGATLIEQLDNTMKTLTSRQFNTFSIVVTSAEYLQICEHINEKGYYKNAIRVTVADVSKSFIGDTQQIQINHNKAPEQRSQQNNDELKRGLTTFYSIVYADCHVLDKSQIIELGV